MVIHNINPRLKRMTQSNTKKAKKEPVILQVLPSLKSGGVEKGTVEIAKALAGKGFKALVASSGGPMEGNITNAGGQHFKLPLASKNPLVILCNIRRLRKIIRKHEVDIVHARSRAPAWSAYFACRKAGIPFVTTFHGLYSFHGYFKKLYNSVMTRGDIVIAASEFIKDHMKSNYKVDDKNIRVIARGVDISLFDREKVPERRILQMAEKLNIDHDRPIIMLPGRMTQWKGHEFLLDALALLPQDSFLCLLVGDNKDHNKYTRRLYEKMKKLGIIENIKMVNHTQDMPAIYSLADIVVSASTRPEAFGRVAIEAQAMERLLVATNHGGSCETVIDGKTGWLVESGNVEELAETLKKLIKISDTQRKTITKRAKKHIQQNFSLQNMTEKTLEVYNEILKKNNKN